jgi:hypothetical protein
MSTSPEAYVVGQKVLLLLHTGQASSKRYEVVKVWRYPTTFRYLLDTGYVADHSELRAIEGGELPVAPSSELAPQRAPEPAAVVPLDGVAEAPDGPPTDD